MKKYADVRVSEHLLVRLKKELDNTKGMARYGRFKAWLHYANLKSWQEQGWHFNYVNVNGLENHCTCGLIIHIDDESEVKGFEDLILDRVQKARGHRNLPALSGICVAFIYDFKYMGELNTYWYTALCQVCLSHTELSPGAEARVFVDEHNDKCLSVATTRLKR